MAITPNCLVDQIDGRSLLLVSNFTDSELTIEKGEPIGIYEFVDNIDIIETGINNNLDEENFEIGDEVTERACAQRSLIDPDQYIEKLRFELGEISIGRNLSDKNRQKLIELLTEYQDVVSFSGRLGCTNLIEYKIDIDRTYPVHVKPYRSSEQQRNDMIEQTKSLLKQGVIEESRSAWSSPILLVRKKDQSWRFVIDYRQVNALTKNYVYEVPLISECLRSLSGFKLFSTFDCLSGYYQIPIRESDREVTAFTVPQFGSFQFKNMAFGLKCAPATWNALMDKALGSLKFTTAIAYMDDIILGAQTYKETESKMKLVFDALRKANITLKPEKCVIATEVLRYLGFVVSVDGIHVDPQKVRAIESLTEPTDVKTLRSFLGKTNYFHDFIPEYSIIAAPLYELIKLEEPWLWTQVHTNAFNKLKRSLIEAPILRHFDPKLETELITDASTKGIAFKLTQRDPKTNMWFPIVYGSKKLTPAEQKWKTTEQECFAVVRALRKNKHYIQNKKFTLVTDHKPLKSLLTKRNLPPKLERWALEVMEFPDIEIKHRAGSKIPDVDFMSRHPVDDDSDTEDYFIDRVVDVISDTNQTPTHDDYILYQANDPRMADIIRRLKEGSLRSDVFFIRNDLLYRMKYGRLVLELPERLIDYILYIHHDSPMSGHGAFRRTYERILQRFHFKDMRKRILEYTKSCLDCQMQKRHQGFRYGMMKIPKAGAIGEKWYIDTIGPFPVSYSGNRHITIAMESYTRYVVAMATPDTTAETMQEFIIKLITKFGCFRLLISDNATSFRSHMMKNLAQQIGYKHYYSSVYHAQSNSVKRANASIVGMISMYCSSSQFDWDEQLDASVFAYNTHSHRSIKVSPFYLMFQRQPILPGEIPTPETKAVKKNRWQIACRLAERRTKIVQQYNKSYYDKRRKSIQFNIGDLVLVRQLATKQGKKTKLLPEYSGPYPIDRKLSDINYEIRLSPKKTEIYHVQMMKRYFPRPEHRNVVNDPIIEFPDEDQILRTAEPEVAESPPTPEQTRPRHTHRYPTRQSKKSIISIIMLLILALSNISCFDIVDRVQWKTTDRKVFSEIQTFNYVVEYHNPCDILREHKSTKQLVDWCETTFTEDFVNEMQTRCHTSTNLSRPKRFPVIVVAVVFIVLGAVGTGSYFAFRSNRKDYERLRRELNAIREKVKREEDVEIHVKRALEIGGQTMNMTQLFADYESKRIASDVALSIIIAHKLSKISNTIRYSIDKDGRFTLSKGIMTMLNATLPCDNCPTEMATLINCHVFPDQKKLNFGVLARKPMNNFRVLSSDPFTIYNIDGIKYCHTLYSGPKVVIIDTETKCVSPVPDYETDQYVAYSKHFIECSAKQFKNWAQLETSSCSVEHTFEEFQLKIGDNYTMIYCFNTTILINGRFQNCPSEPFKLSLKTAFQILDFTFDRSAKTLTSQTYFWTKLTNKYLNYSIGNPNSSLIEYFKEVDNIVPPEGGLEQSSGHYFWIIIGILIGLFSIIGIYIGIRIYVMRTFQSNLLARIHQDVAFSAAQQLSHAVRAAVSQEQQDIEQVE